MPNDEAGRPRSPSPSAAAEYLRMSTEHQQYSTENQKTRIEEYARKRGLTIVKTYTDAGKSGLSLSGRKGLAQLIEEVKQGPDYSHILVYDVSRWGRFQDADESAYYEYICRRNGIKIHYCAEQFENDGSPVATIVKGVKRAMAGEYSRELSSKVFAGHCRLVELGFRQGGPPGYGLRRLRVDHSGNALGILSPGERKSIQTDRVILVPGPEDEIKLIREVFDLFVKEGLSEGEITARLNGQGKYDENGKPWSRGKIRQILTNEKYIGNNVYNRTSSKLHGKRIRNDPDIWIRNNKAFQAIVEDSIFYAAHGIFIERSRRYSDDELLLKLDSLRRKQGCLSAVIIDEADGLPSSSAYAHRFGGLIRAYKLIGYVPAHDYAYVEANQRIRRIYPVLFNAIVNDIKALGGYVSRDSDTDLLKVNDEIYVSLLISRCCQTPKGSRRWMLRLENCLAPDLTVAARMQEDNEHIKDFYILPMFEINGPRIRLSDSNGFELDAFRFENLERFNEMAARVELRNVA